MSKMSTSWIGSKETAKSDSKNSSANSLNKTYPLCDDTELKGDSYHTLTSDSEQADGAISIRSISNTPRSTNTDDDLYGTSEGFKKTLEDLRNKLLSLNVSDSTNSSDDSMDNNFKDRCLFTREAYINISSPFEGHRFTERFKDYSYIKRTDTFRSAISTIYEAQEFSESSSASSGSYRVPEKKLCLRKAKCLDKSSQVTIESPESDNLGQIHLDLPMEDSSESSLYSTKIFNKQTWRFSPIDTSLLKPIDEVKLHLPLDILSKSSNNFTTDSSDHASLNYQTPIKKRCVRSKTPIIALNSIQEENNADIKKNIEMTVLNLQTATKLVENNIKPDTMINTLNEAGDFSSSIVTSIPNKIDIFRNSVTSSDKTPSTHLSCSIIDEDIGNNEVLVKTKIRTIQRKIKKACKRSRSNRVSDISSARLSFTTDLSSGDFAYEDEDTPSKRLALLYKKYYTNSSEVSINEISTPPATISTNNSSSAKYSSASSRDSKLSDCLFLRNEILNPSKSQFIRSFNADNKSEIEKVSLMLEPLFCSSLDVPRLSLHAYIFPAITKIIKFPEILQHHFILDNSEFIDNNIGSRMCNKKSDCFINEGFLSLLDDDSDQNVFSRELNDKLLNNMSNKETSKCHEIEEIFQARRKQSTDLSYYSVVSETILNEVQENQESNDGYRNVLKACMDWCCLKIFFSKTKT